MIGVSSAAPWPRLRKLGGELLIVRFLLIACGADIDGVWLDCSRAKPEQKCA
ncbi:MAG: hypothetical protein ACI9OO_001360 [Bacteroidia bacterium]|jgi:hypothetical protein